MTTTRTPLDAATAVLDDPALPAGDDERFVGFGVMGLPFGSGHYLALRQFPATSFSPGYRSVWHRDRDGVWTFYATTPARRAVPATSARRPPATRSNATSTSPGLPRGRCSSRSRDCSPGASTCGPPSPPG
ncbi:hypothetical protein I549_1832 [Mycobacterium avium subsp. avium 2285 (R)]|nr:hypothetical protein I549_1832 [Mycobacterium avium subsp. avium 2285 (R)]